MNNFQSPIHNIYSNVSAPKSISSSLTVTASEHLPQFLVSSDIFSSPTSTKWNIYWKRLSQALSRKLHFWLPNSRLGEFHWILCELSDQVQFSYKYTCTSKKVFKADSNANKKKIQYQLKLIYSLNVQK